MNNDLAIVDLICAALRKRIGEVVAVMEKSPVFGPFVARMDAEAVDWVLKAVQKNKIDLGKNDYAMNINIPSTRHLIISLQGILLGIPLEKRGFIYDDMFTLHPSLKWLKSFERDENVAKTWFEKKGKCDALLSLSTSLAQKLSSQK